MKLRIWIAVSAIGWTSLLFITGCNPAIPVPDDAISVSEAEPDNTFLQAQPVPLTPTTPIKIDGSFTGIDDTDMFSLGSFQAGQRISVNLQGVSMFASSEASFGLFDQDQDVAYLDQVTVSGGSADSFALVLRKPGTYYLGVLGSAPFSAGAFDYSAVVQVESDQVPSPQKQIVFLNYDGAAGVRIGSDLFAQVSPFSNFGYPISDSALAGQVTALVRQDFTGLDIEFVSSFESAQPSSPHSTVYMSANEDNFFGLADSVDWYNQNQTDNAIIFAGLFNHSGLTQEQFVRGTANVTSHEIGHLVGLAHTDDDTELMDVATPLQQLVRPQDFHRTRLASSEFTIGAQDSLELLQFALGILQ